MDPTRTAGQNIAIASVPNLRDLGGWSTPGGRVRSGLIFRSAEFSNLQGDDAKAFGKLGIRSVFDLRTAEERTVNPNQVPAGTEYIVIDVLQDAQGASPALMAKVLGDPKFAEGLLGVSKEDVYADYLLTNEQLLPALEPMFRKFAAAGGDRQLIAPVLGVQPSFLDAAIAEMENRYGR